MLANKNRLSQWICLWLTLKTFTSFLFLISSTSLKGFPLGTGIVPSITVPDPFKICWTAWINVWLKSSILPISSIMHTFFTELLSKSVYEKNMYGIKTLSGKMQNIFTWLKSQFIWGIHYLMPPDLWAPAQRQQGKTKFSVRAAGQNIRLSTLTFREKNNSR